MDLKLEKWEPERIGRIPDGFVSAYKGGISIPKWAWDHISEMVDLYLDPDAKVVGIKPSGNTRKIRKLSSTGKTKFITCSELTRKFGIGKRRLCKAEWSKKHKMLLIRMGD